MACNKEHEEIQEIMKLLPIDQGGVGRHKCAACAYEIGFQDGLKRKEVINLSETFDRLEYSQAKQQRHKSPYAAYALGYFNGVKESYK